MSSHRTVTSSQKKTTTAQPSWDGRKEPVPALLTLILLLLFSGSQQGLLPLCRRRRHAGPVPPGPASPLSRRRRLAAGGRCRPGARPPTAANGPGASRAGHVPGRAQLSVRLRAPARARGPGPAPSPFPFPSHRGAPAGESPSRGAAVGGWGGVARLEVLTAEGRLAPLCSLRGARGAGCWLQEPAQGLSGQGRGPRCLSLGVMNAGLFFKKKPFFFF